jgi:ComF family protein
MAGGECTVCSNRMFYISRNVVAAEYAGVVEEALHHFKFNRRKRLRVPLGELACGEFRRRGIEADLVTAVPMSISKKWKRGFNQSEMVARVVARRLGKPYRNLLRERLWSPTQRHLRPRDRFVNVLGRYRVCSPAKVRGMRILLVDDIFTTGATMNECARVLMQSGAVEVNSLAVARAGIKKLEKL